MKAEPIDSSKLSALLDNASTATEDADYSVAADSYKEAADMCEKALIQYRCAQARALLSAEEYDTVKSLAESIIQIAPQQATPSYLKASALYHLNDKQAAKTLFLKAAKYETDLHTKTAYNDWAMRCDTSPEQQQKEQPIASPSPSPSPALSNGSSDRDISGTKTATKPPTNTARMNWYQSKTFVNMDIFAKNVIKEQSKVVFDSNHLSIHLKRSDGTDDYVSDITLAQDINPAESRWTVSRMKVEIRLCKLTPGSTWKTLDRQATVQSAVVEAGISSKQRMDETRVRQKQWESLADQELKDYKEDDSSMSLFKTIYKDADEDTKRAMAKSYSESGGQVLSTNWDEVKKKKVVYEGKD